MVAKNQTFSHIAVC